MKTPNPIVTLQSGLNSSERQPNDHPAATAKSDSAVPAKQPVSNTERGAASSAPKALIATVTGTDAPWANLIGPAKLHWEKLTPEELQKTEGNEHRLATLVQARYKIPRGDAYRQVKSFHAGQKS